VNMNKMSLLEEFMNGHGGCVTDPEESREGIGAGSQVGELPCILQIMSRTGFEWVLLLSVCACVGVYVCVCVHVCMCGVCVCV